MMNATSNPPSPRRRMRWAALLAGPLAAAVAAWPAAAEGIDGRYRIEGTNPGAPGTYRGEALIKKEGGTYGIVWQVGGSQQVGTGILTGSVLSVVFRAVGSTQSGVASFSIEGDAVKGGEWTNIGGRNTGTERWTRE